MYKEGNPSLRRSFKNTLSTTFAAVLLPVLSACGGNEDGIIPAVPTPACPYIDVKPGEKASLGQFLVINGLPSAEVQIIDGRTASSFLLPRSPLGRKIELPRADATVTFANENHVYLEKDCSKPII